MNQKFRLDKGGLINRDKKISFKFNGKNYFGYEGDTLASALIANGVHLVREVCLEQLYEQKSSRMQELL